MSSKSLLRSSTRIVVVVVVVVVVVIIIVVQVVYTCRIHLKVAPATHDDDDGKEYNLLCSLPNFLVKFVVTRKKRDDYDE